MRLSQLDKASAYARQQRVYALPYSTSFPQTYGLGETWDRDVLKMVGASSADIRLRKSMKM